MTADCACGPAEAGSGGSGVFGQSKPRLIDVFRDHGADYRRTHPLSPEQARLLHDLETCRTRERGGHLDVCPGCGHEQPMYNSCGNRHCPSCQSLSGARWLAERAERVLPVGHFHVVFTLPEELRPIALRNQRTTYDLLFDAAARTLNTLAADLLGAQLGVTIVLHTWTRQLLAHPHVHCIVSGGGLALDGSGWVQADDNYLFPAARMRALFRALVLASIGSAYDSDELHLGGSASHLEDPVAFARMMGKLWKKKWVVHVEAPQGGSQHVFGYLGRYLRRVAISDQRLLAYDDDGVSFRTRGDNRMTLAPEEFIRRFLLHSLPSGFRKVRHFGLYAPGNVNGRLETARALVLEAGLDIASLPRRGPAPRSWVELIIVLTGQHPLRCPKCHQAIMVAQPLPSSWPEAPPWRDTS